jgi:hypothetical protein
LVITRELSGKQHLDDHYRDPYLAAHVDPFGDAALERAVKTDVEAKKKDKWVM